MIKLFFVPTQHNEATLLPVIGYAEKRCKGTVFYTLTQILHRFFTFLKFYPSTSGGTNGIMSTNER